MPSALKHDIEPWKEVIEERTREGDSLEQIARHLASKGFSTSSKTIGRYRIQWGVRQRAAGRCGKKYPNRKRKIPSEGGPSKHVDQDQRKKEITERTERGETAEQIADALAAEGFPLKKGASTVWRLQTYWGLIPYDTARSRGKYSKARLEARNKPKAPRRKDSQAPADPTAFYPSNCAHGPQKRLLAPRVDPEGDQPIDLDPAFNSEPEPLRDVVESDISPQPHPQPQSHPTRTTQMQTPPKGSGYPPVNVAAQLMSAELLVDLATSTLAAASRVKELYVAQQMGVPARGSLSSTPPTNEDITIAKQKVREAAGVMYDLAA